MRVPHGGGYGLVPQEFLNGSNIHALHHPLACPEMAQVVVCHEDAKASCCAKDEGQALRSRLVGGGFKLP